MVKVPHHVYENNEPLDELDQRQIDFTNHAINRVEVVLRDITQFMEGGHQVYALLLSVASTLVRSAGMVRQAAEEEHGCKMALEQAERLAILDLLRGMGITIDA